VTENVGAEVRHGEDGFVVPIRDANALAEKIRFYYEYPEERIRMGRSVRDYVQQFTWHNYHQEVIQHYDSILTK
jgi:glycosyltransferase involved in cell wall biosynthesis